MSDDPQPSDISHPPRLTSAVGGPAGGPSPRRKAASRLDELLSQARVEEHRSVENLAEMAGVVPNAIRLLEAGEGPVATLAAVMNALPFQVAGLAKGRSFTEQLRNRRAKMGLSARAVAVRAGLRPDDILELEAGGGSVEHLLRLLAVIGPRIHRKRKERAHWSAAATEERNSRFTPANFLALLREVFGEIALDPCGHRSSPVEARRRFLLEDGDDGLVDPWSGNFAFVNPPFADQLSWLRRAHGQWKAGNVRKVVVLIPTRTDSAFFQDVVKAEADLYFMRNRLKFADPHGAVSPTPHSIMLVMFGADAGDRARLEARVPGFWVAAGVGAVRSRRVPATPVHGTCGYDWDVGQAADQGAIAVRILTCNATSSPINVTCGPEPRL